MKNKLMQKYSKNLQYYYIFHTKTWKSSVGYTCHGSYLCDCTQKLKISHKFLSQAMPKECDI